MVLPMDCPRIAARAIPRQPFWIPRLFLQRTRWFEERNPARKAASPVDTVVSSSYFSRVKRLRLWAILLILDVAAAYPLHLPHILLGRRPPTFCRLFIFSHASSFGSSSFLLVNAPVHSPLLSQIVTSETEKYTINIFAKYIY